MKKLSVPFVLLLALAFTASPTRTQSRVSVPQALADRAAAGESVSVIVGVDVPFTPQGDLAGPAAIAEQQALMGQVLDAVMARAAAAGVADAVRFDHIPFFAARADRAALENLAATPGVRSIEEDFLMAPGLAQSVPFVNAPAAWAAGATGAGWNVAVLDTGVDSSHSFLAGKVVAQACYSAGGGGLSVCPGSVNSPIAGGGACNPVISGCDHGTHVAGIVAGASGSGNGTAPGANLVAMQVFTRIDGSDCSPSASPCARVWYSDLLRGMVRVYEIAGANNVNRVAAINLSLGGQQFFNYCDGTSPVNSTHSAMKTAVDALRSIGVATVASSGNNGFRDSMGFPACVSSAISVGSTRDAFPPPVGQTFVSSFSNNAPFLSLYAPGQGIVSSVPGGGTASFNGTSMAAPHVAGAFAILKQAMPSASVSAMLAALQTTGMTVTDDRSSPGTPHPLININAARLALLAASGLPGAPTGLTATVNGNQLTLSWTAPASGGTVSGYALAVTQSPIGAGNIQVGAATSFAANVPNGAYMLSVRAFNAAGAGPTSNVVSFNVPVLPAPPGIVTGLAGNVAGNTVSFTWNAPASGGPVANYVLQAGTTPGFTTPLLSTALPASPRSFAVGGVPAGTYYVRVLAQNAGGTSPSFSNEVTVNVAGPQPPGAPTLNTPVVTGNSVSLSWSAGAGGAPTSYTLLVSSTSGGAPVLSVPLSGTGVAFGGVPNGQYFLRLVAHNALGTSPPSNQVQLLIPAP